MTLGRTSAFFLGGGRAMLNALYRTAEKLGADILYDAPECSECRSTDNVTSAL
jgi:tricarballylate dehydrogenase